MTDGGSSRRTHRIAALLFATLLFVYLGNGTETDEGDALPTLKLPFALLSQHRLSFDPAWYPDLFDWRGHPPFVEKNDITFPNWAWVFGTKTAAEWRLEGKLEFRKPKYFVFESPTRHTYVSVFGPVPGLAFLPFVAPFYAFDADLHRKGRLRAKVAKLAGASMVAGTACLIFLIARRHASERRALFLALLYGLATCAWSQSSQTVWQQTVNQLLLTVGAFFVLGRAPPNLAWAGLAFGTAAACRSTGVFVLAAVAFELLLTDKKGLVRFVLAAAPPLALIALYNFYYFGNPLTFAQTVAGRLVAYEKTGSYGLFSTPLWYGALGLLVSPSRGLLVFSPVLAASFLGMARLFRDPAYRALRPFAASALAMMALQCKWFDWWGGHTYGYRPWFDVMPYLTLSILPVLPDWLGTPVRRAALAAAFAWSVFVQAVGAWSYDHSWNLRSIHVVKPSDGGGPIGFLEQENARRAVAEDHATYVGSTSCDIDLPRCRYRLWSVADSIIPYHLTHFSATHRSRLHGSYLDFLLPPEDYL